MKKLFLILFFTIFYFFEANAGAGSKWVLTGSQAHILEKEIGNAIYIKCISQTIRDQISHCEYPSNCKNGIVRSISRVLYSAIQAKNSKDLSQVKKNMESGNLRLEDFLAFQYLPANTDTIFSLRKTMNENLKSCYELSSIYSRIKDLAKEAKQQEVKVEEEMEYIYNHITMLVNDYNSRGFENLINRTREKRQEIGAFKKRVEKMMPKIVKERQRKNDRGDDLAHLEKRLAQLQKGFDEHYSALSYPRRVWLYFRTII